MASAADGPSEVTAVGILTAVFSFFFYALGVIVMKKALVQSRTLDLRILRNPVVRFTNSKKMLLGHESRLLFLFV